MNKNHFAKKRPDNVPVLDLGLNHNPPQAIEATDEVAHRVREKIIPISNPAFKVDYLGAVLINHI